MKAIAKGLVVLLGHDRLAKFANRIHDELAERAAQRLAVQHGLVVKCLYTTSKKKHDYRKYHVDTIRLTVEWKIRFLLY